MIARLSCTSFVLLKSVLHLSPVDLVAKSNFPLYKILNLSSQTRSVMNMLYLETAHFSNYILLM